MSSSFCTRIRLRVALLAVMRLRILLLRAYVITSFTKFITLSLSSLQIHYIVIEQRIRGFLTNSWMPVEEGGRVMFARAAARARARTDEAAAAVMWLSSCK
jgi:hypothetical protein